MTRRPNKENSITKGNKKVQAKSEISHLKKVRTLCAPLGIKKTIAEQKTMPFDHVFAKIITW